jgi:hypothetical protein
MRVGARMGFNVGMPSDRAGAAYLGLRGSDAFPLGGLRNGRDVVHERDDDRSRTVAIDPEGYHRLDHGVVGPVTRSFATTGRP